MNNCSRELVWLLAVIVVVAGTGATGPTGAAGAGGGGAMADAAADVAANAAADAAVASAAAAADMVMRWVECGREAAMVACELGFGGEAEPRSGEPTRDQRLSLDRCLQRCTCLSLSRVVQRVDGMGWGVKMRQCRSLRVMQ